MKPSPIQAPYRFAFCPRPEAERMLAQGASAALSEVNAHFGTEERAALESLPALRRLDRLAGRIAAKRALADHFLAAHGWKAEPRELAVFNDESGRPLLSLPKDAPPAPVFSISHCARGGAAAVAAPDCRVGVDVETIVARPPQVLAFVCAPSERAAAELRPPDPEAQARLWTGKEAALKLLCLGLDADARDVRLDGETVALAGRPAEAWRVLGSPRITLTYALLEGAMLAVAYTGD